MSDLFKHRHAKLGRMVLRLFPKVMRMILNHFVTAHGLKRKYLQKDFRFVFTEKEIALMDKLPNMDEFTIEICYKILRSENMLDEPKCRWGNAPHDTEIEITDDIQRLIKATNSIIGIKSEEVTEHYVEKLLEEIKLMVTRIDSYLEQDTLRSMYNNLCVFETDCISILQDLTSVKVIEVAESFANTDSKKKEMFSRLAIPIIETFPKILRDVIEKTMPAKLLYQMCFPDLKYFYDEQKTIIKEAKLSNSYGSFDVTLIYKLLNKFSLIQKPTKGWGNLPDILDINLGDDVERIRFYRNKLAHRIDTKVDKKEFNEIFDEFRDIGYRMDQNSNQGTKYEQEIIGYRTCGLDTTMQAKYENAMKEIENIKLRFERMPIRMYWGESFERSLMDLRSMLKDAKLEGREKVRVQIVFQNEADVERNVEVLNSLKDEINEGLRGIELINASKGSLVLHVDILMEILETDDQLLTTLAFLLKTIMQHITIFPTETIDVVVLPVEESTQWKKPKTSGEQVHLDFDIEAQLLENDNILVEQLRKISDSIIKYSNGGETNQNITATLLPINLENITTAEEAFSQAQIPVKNNLSVSVSLRHKLEIKKSTNENIHIDSCITIGNAFVFSDLKNNRLIICNSDGTDVHHIPLSYQPSNITAIDSNTVAVSCTLERSILIINISTHSVTRTIKTSGPCCGISYDDNNLYVVIDERIIHLMDLTGKVVRTITLPSDGIRDITVDRNRLFCIDYGAIYCCSLDGKLIWNFKNDNFKGFHRVTTDGAGSVYVPDWNTCTVVLVSCDGTYHRELLTASDGLIKPWGIYFDKKENVLLVCNLFYGRAFLFDVKRKLS